MTRFLSNGRRRVVEPPAFLPIDGFLGNAKTTVLFIVEKIIMKNIINTIMIFAFACCDDDDDNDDRLLLLLLLLQDPFIANHEKATTFTEGANSLVSSDVVSFLHKPAVVYTKRYDTEKSSAF